jgi:hypothetical protein
MKDMNILTHDEFWFINVYFGSHGFKHSHDIMDINIYMMRLACHNTVSLIHSLIKKNILNQSPNGRQVKFTDYGIEVYLAMKHAQADWEKKPLIRVTNLEHDEILIHSGEGFRANRIVRELFSSASTELCIIDPYVGSQLFDLLQDSRNATAVRIITSARVSAATKQTYLAYHTQEPRVEMRIIAGDIHDRFVLWDGSKGFHIGHSIKDLGTKDTQLNLIKDPKQQLQLFESRWSHATAIT